MTMYGAGLRDDKCWVHHDEDCALCARYWLRTDDAEYLCGPQSHPDFPGVCLTCGDSLIEKDGTWVHATDPKRGLKGKR